MVIVCKLSPNYLTKNKNIDIISIGGRMKKKISSILILLTIWIIPLINVNAKTISDMDNELAQLQKSYNAAKNKANMTQAELNKVKANISSTEAEIKNTQNEIIKAENDIQESEKSIEEKKEQTNQMLLYLQLAGKDESYLNYLFEADDYTEFIYRYSVVSQLTGHNNKIMDELERLNKELEQKKKDLAEKQATLEKQNNEYNAKVVKLRANLNIIDQDGATIEEDIRDSRKVINYYKSIGCSLDQSLDACVSVVYATGWRYPIAYGTVTSVYTGKAERTDWPAGGPHHGIDLANNEVYGMPVYAAAPGEVSVARWISGGGNAVYIYHNVNGQNYTSVYMHLSKIADGIKQGTKVTSDTIVGYAGNTGGNYAAHLHFGVARGWRIPGWDFNEGSINPNSKEVLYFSPGLYGPYFYRK